MPLNSAARNSVKRAVYRIATNPVLRPCGLPLLHAAQYVLSIHYREVVSFAQPHRAKVAERIRAIMTTWHPQTMGVEEAFLIHSAVLATSKVQGDIAEVGVFRGASAKVICEAKGDRQLHLFDTFEGLPQPGQIDSAFEKGQYACTLEDVRSFLNGFSKVEFHKGYFPSTGAPVADRKFSFIHLDVDLYESTFQALEFFYPRMDRGAIVISHDYVEFPGVRKAFDEFFADKPEPVLEMSGNQCVVTKVAP